MEFTDHQEAQTLLSPQAWDYSRLLTPPALGPPHSQPSPESRFLSLELSQKEQRADLASSQQRQWWLGLQQQAHAHPGPTRTTVQRERTHSQEAGYVNTVVARWARAQKNRRLCR